MRRRLSVDGASVILGQCGEKVISAETMIGQIVAEINDSDQRIATDITILNETWSAIEQVHAKVVAIESGLVTQISTNEQQAAVTAGALGTEASDAIATLRSQLEAKFLQLEESAQEMKQNVYLGYQKCTVGFRIEVRD